MISKFLILFSTIFSHAFSGMVITDHNSYCEFNVREVERIGQIKIDGEFVDYVLSENASTYVIGIQLQKQLFDYIEGKVKSGLDIRKKDKFFQYLNNLIHVQELDNHGKIMTILEVALLALFHTGYSYWVICEISIWCKFACAFDKRSNQISNIWQRKEDR